MYRNILLVLICLLDLGAVAQEKWSLDSCIVFGIKNNLTVRNASLSSEIADVNYSQSKWNYMPDVYAGGNAGMNYGRSIDPTTNGVVKTSFLSNSYYINASVDLFRGFSQMNELAYQRYLSISAENNKRKVEDEIAFAVMNAFFDVVYFDELVRIATEQKELSKFNLKKTEVLVATGLKAEADLLEVKANVEKDELFYIQSKNQHIAALLNLRKAMNVGSDLPLDIEKPQDSLFVIPSFDTNSDSLFQVFSSSSPQLSSLENEWKASVKNISIKRANYYPTLSLEASFSTAYYETNKDTAGRTYEYGYQLRNNQSQYVGLSLVVPIFRRNEVRSSVKKAKLQSEVSRNMLDKARQDIQLEIVENVNSMAAASRELVQTQNQLQADKLAFDAAQKKYDKGMIGVVDFYTAKNRMSTTKGQLLRARLTLEVKKRTIDFYKGIRFWE
ncbi:MAG: TolC family protein [Bacteroidales bacterium]